MKNVNGDFVVEYSVTERCTRIHKINEMLATNVRSMEIGVSSDYKPIAFANGMAEARSIAKDIDAKFGSFSKC